MRRTSLHPRRLRPKQDQFAFQQGWLAMAPGSGFITVLYARARPVGNFSEILRRLERVRGYGSELRHVPRTLGL